MDNSSTEKIDADIQFGYLRVHVLPEVVELLREEAAQSHTSASELAGILLEQTVLTREQAKGNDREEGFRARRDQRKSDWHDWAASHQEKKLPKLTDEAFQRASFYEGQD